MLGGWGGNRGPGGKHWKPTAGFIASVTCGLTAEDGDWLWNPTLVAGMGLPLRLFYITAGAGLLGSQGVHAQNGRLNC